MEGTHLEEILNNIKTLAVAITVLIITLIALCKIILFEIASLLRRRAFWRDTSAPRETIPSVRLCNTRGSDTDKGSGIS